MLNTRTGRGGFSFVQGLSYAAAAFAGYLYFDDALRFLGVDVDPDLPMDHDIYE